MYQRTVDKKQTEYFKLTRALIKLWDKGEKYEKKHKVNIFWESYSSVLPAYMNKHNCNIFHSSHKHAFGADKKQIDANLIAGQKDLRAERHDGTQYRDGPKYKKHSRGLHPFQTLKLDKKSG